MTLSGLTTPSSGLYNVSLDGAPYTTLRARASFTDNAPTLLYYAAGLDATLLHSVEIVNAGADATHSGTLLAVLAGGANVTTDASPSSG